MNKLNKSIDLSKIYNNKLVQIIINILFSISTASLTAILIVGEWSNSIIDIILPTLSFSIMLFITFKFQLLKLIFRNSNKIILFASAILGAYAIYLTSLNMLDYSTTFAHAIYLLLAIPSAITFLYWFYSKLWYYAKLFFKSLDKMEKGFLIIAICVSSIGIIIIYNITTIFTYAYVPDEKRTYNLSYDIKNEETIKEGKELVERTYGKLQALVYTSDTQVLLETDTFNNINDSENDIRQPFFSLFAMPFTILPKLIASLSLETIYPFLIAIVQAILVFISIILLEKIIHLKGISKLLFMIFLSIAYPTLLFIINMEQYVIPVFYLIVFIYMAINNIKSKEVFYIFATGSMLTSGIFFPLLGEKKDFKKSVKMIFFTALKFLAIFIISAKILLFSPYKLNDQLELFSFFVHEAATPTQRVNMYTNFTLNTVLAPEIKAKEYLFAHLKSASNEHWIELKAYNQCIDQANNDKTNIFGIIILILITLGFVFNRKDTFAQICFAWVLFSIVLLVIFGYGAFENGFILYTYYFSWAFVCLLFKFFETVLQKWPKVKNTIYVLAIIPVAVINFYGIYQLIEFGLQYYC